jgi:hypothetical protein
MVICATLGAKHELDIADIQEAGQGRKIATSESSPNDER